MPEIQSHTGEILVPTWKAGTPAAFDLTITSSLKSNFLTNADTKAGYALDAEDGQRYCPRDENCSQMGITFVAPAVEVLGRISATFIKKNSSGWPC